MFQKFERGNKGELKMVKYQLLKTDISLYCHLIKISKCDLSVFDYFVLLALKGLSFLNLISNRLNGIKFLDPN